MIRRVPPALAPTSLALAIGTIGAALATAIQLPAAPLIGSCLVVSAAAAAGLRVALPTRLRDVAFVIIGISLGAGVEAEALSRAPEWLLSLSMLAASLLATLAVGAWLLRRTFGLDADTALLATSPGTMSYAVAVALDGRGDAGVVITLQLIRLLLMVTAVPIVVGALGLAADARPAPQAMHLAPLALLLMLGYGLGTIGGRLGLPAAALLAGMVLTTAAHLKGAAEGAAPGWLLYIGLIVTGTAIGTRISGIARGRIAALIRAGLASVLATALLSFLFAVVTARLTDLPLGQVWIAFAPGGVEAMAAIGLALGYDPAFVALHHFARIVLLLAIIPVILRLLPKRA
ncbi:MAG: AbrB family transcriptional regulator [Paracoccus sp. (in: a-proteobacteria)]|uniref:AbrB family transcriptional regulator n=1 Tax=Paracoccus sp. TaxID=267 RepID=UPI002E869F2F|nr:AbrB family transcriptional regulator [Pseudomonadota bacterium]